MSNPRDNHRQEESMAGMERMVMLKFCHDSDEAVDLAKVSAGACQNLVEQNKSLDCIILVACNWRENDKAGCAQIMNLKMSPANLFSFLTGHLGNLVSSAHLSWIGKLHVMWHVWTAK